MYSIQEKESLYTELIDLLQRNDSINFLWLNHGQKLFDTVIVPLLNPKLHKLVRELYDAGKITESDFGKIMEVSSLSNSNIQL